MKKTKIICTNGPNTNDAGTECGRWSRMEWISQDLIFSHGDHEEQKDRMDMLKKIREEENKPVAILLDTKGPEIRTGILKDGKKINLQAGNLFTLSTEDIVGDESKVSITYADLVEDVQVGSTILVDDGLIGLKVKEKKAKEIVCTVINGGELGERKGVNVPMYRCACLPLPIRTERISASA